MFLARAPLRVAAKREYVLRFSAIPEAYERLFLDALEGDAALFMRDDEIERAWQIMDPFIAAAEGQSAACPEYAPGSAGPACADEFLAPSGRQWLSLCHH